MRVGHKGDGSEELCSRSSGVDTGARWNTAPPRSGNLGNKPAKRARNLPAIMVPQRRKLIASEMIRVGGVVFLCARASS